MSILFDAIDSATSMFEEHMGTKEESHWLPAPSERK